MQTTTRALSTGCALAASTLLLTGCALTSLVSEPTVENTAELQELYVDAGGYCPEAILVSSTEAFGDAADAPIDMSIVKVAGCSDANLQDTLGVLMVFEDKGQREEYVTAAGARLEASGETWGSSELAPVVGGNWMVLVDTRSNPEAIAESMDGEVLTGP